MKKRITIEPMTRIEGHLKIEVEIEDGKVKDAVSSGTMTRGFETLLIDKDPRDAPFVTSRICGVCFSVHQIASTRALEMAFGARVPWPGTLIRNLVMAAEYIYDHPLHFYQLAALDYIDIMATAKYRGKDKDLLKVKDKIASLMKAGDTYPFTPRYKPDEYTVTDPDIVITAVKHYIDALKMHAQARNMGAIWGGRTPHYQNIVVGGVTSLPDINQVVRFKSMLDQQAKFIKEVYIPDVLAFANGPLWKLARLGLGGGHYNYLAFGAFEMDESGKDLVFPQGVVTNLDPTNLKKIKVKSFDHTKITESVEYAWYRESKPLHPYNGEHVYEPNKKKAYSFVKAPRYQGKPMEVGPLARMIVAKHPDVLNLMKRGARPGVVLRHVARAIETKLIIDASYRWLDELLTAMTKPGFRIHDEEHWEPKDGLGFGLFEAPRGALGHWVKIKDKKIEHYQIISPTTWNASPRCEKHIRGPYEEALIGTPVPDPESPVNVVRVIRSFDPCLACAIHLIDPNSNELKRFTVQ